MGEFGLMFRMIAILVVVVVGLAVTTAVQSAWSPPAPTGIVAPSN
jgi:hypothetical protein